jgi:hypothetical protein
MSVYREHFRPAVPPYAARDTRANHAIVLVVGHWVDERGREIAVQVAATTQRRGLMDVAPLPPSPQFEPIEEQR